MAKLTLDPLCVLNAWEEMGGSSFSTDDLHLDDPAAFTLDLSGWEARLKPLSGSGLFGPAYHSGADAALDAFSGLCPATSCDAAPSDSAQVVPTCPTPSAGSLDNGLGPCPDDACFMDAGVLDDVDAGSLDGMDGMRLSLSFPDLQHFDTADASPTSSEAGVVPDIFGGAAAFLGRSSSSTATSGRNGPALGLVPICPSIPVPVPCGPGSPALAPLAQPSSALFVPMDQTGLADMSNMLPTVKSESAEASIPYEDASAATAAATSAYEAQCAQPAVEQKARPPAQRAPASGSAAAQAQSAQQASGHFRTRAECLERYREKKARRMYTKKIRYQLRKINADKRPRIKGRFVKKEELAEFLATQQSTAAYGCEEGDVYGAMDSDDE